MLVSDSDSEGASDKSGGASDFSASEESQQSESDGSSMEDSDEESPPPAKRGKKVLCHAMLRPLVQAVPSQNGIRFVGSPIDAYGHPSTVTGITTQHELVKIT